MYKVYAFAVTIQVAVFACGHSCIISVTLNRGGSMILLVELM